MTSQEYAREIERKAAELKNIFDMSKTNEIDPENGQPFHALDDNQVKEVRARNKELEELEGKRVAAELREISEATDSRMRGVSTPRPRVPQAYTADDDAMRNGQPFVARGRGYEEEELQDIAAMVVNSLEFKRRNRADRNKFSVEIQGVNAKTLLITSTGFAPANARGPYITYKPERTPSLADLIPTDPTSLQVIKYMEETTATHGAASVSEGAAKPESAFAYTERSAPVVKLANWIPVTEEQIDDVPGLGNVINNRLMDGVRLREEWSLLNGPGGSTDMQGFYNNSSVQTQSKASDELQDAIYKAMQKCRWTGFAEPSAVAIHPDDWTTIRLLRTNAGTTGLYIWGAPSQPGPDTLWGKPVVQTPVVTAARPLTGAFNVHAHISRRTDMRVDVSDSHSDYFTRNILAIRAEIREALEIYRPTAFCYVVA